MNRLECEACGTVFYSAAAKTLVEQGYPCGKCGGKLAAAPVQDPRATAGRRDQ